MHSNRHAPFGSRSHLGGKLGQPPLFDLSTTLSRCEEELRRVRVRVSEIKRTGQREGSDEIDLWDLRLEIEKLRAQLAQLGAGKELLDAKA